MKASRVTVRCVRHALGASAAAKNGLSAVSSCCVSDGFCSSSLAFPMMRLPSRAFSSSSSRPDSNTSRPSSIPPRPWLDRKIPLDIRVKKLMEAQLGTLDPHVIEFDALDLISKSCGFQDFVGMKYAHDVLDRVLAEKRFFDEEKEPNGLPFPVPAKLFDTILYGWATMAEKGKVTRIRMRETLNFLIEIVKYDDEKLDKLPRETFSAADRQMFERFRLLPTVNTYNTILTGFRNASRVSRDAAVEAEELLHEMKTNHSKYGWHTKPNTKSYSLVVSAYANSGLKYAGKNAERILRTIQQTHEIEKKAYLEQYGVPYNTLDISANKRRIVTADAIVYNSVIKAYSHRCSPYEAGRARDLLIEAMDTTDGTVHLDIALFTGVINAFAHVAQNMKLPSDTRYSAARHAEELLLVMLEHPCFDLQQSSNLGKRRKSELNMVSPFNACMNAYAKCGSSKAAYKAESILEKLVSSYVAGESTIQPNSISFNSVLNAWSQCGNYDPDAPQKAEELLKLQLDLIESGKLDQSARPDSQAFAVVISAYGRSNNPQKVQHAYRLLQQMLAGIVEGKVLSGKNIAVPFTAVLNAAAHAKPSSGMSSLTDDQEVSGKASSDSSEAAISSGFNSVQADTVYSIALQTYREMKDDVYDIGCKPDHIAFATMLHAVGAHTEPDSVERRQMVQVVFEDACAAGHVSRLVMKALRSECPGKELYSSLLGSNELAESIKSVDELPKAWTRNVPQNFRILIRDYDKTKNQKQMQAQS